MKTAFYILICILISSFGLSSYAESRKNALPQPSNNVYINDFAGVMENATEAAIGETSASIERKSKAQIAVVTINTTGGKTIEEYSLELLRKWGIGDRELNNGVLVLVAIHDRQARIEVGYGLEDVLNDAKCGRIIDEMLPYFKKGDYDHGILKGYGIVASVVGTKYNINVKTPGTTNTSSADDIDDWWQWYLQQSPIEKIIIAILLLIIACFLFGTRAGRIILIGVFRSSGGGHKGGFGGSGRGGSGGGGGASRRW